MTKSKILDEEFSVWKWRKNESEYFRLNVAKQPIKKLSKNFEQLNQILEEIKKLMNDFSPET